MGNMQQIKGTNNFSEIEEFASNPEKLTTTLSEVIGKFNLKNHLAAFDVLKSKGLAISSLVSILVILPFFGFASAAHWSRLKSVPQTSKWVKRMFITMLKTMSLSIGDRYCCYTQNGFDF